MFIRSFESERERGYVRAGLEYCELLPLLLAIFACANLLAHQFSVEEEEEILGRVALREKRVALVRLNDLEKE